MSRSTHRNEQHRWNDHLELEGLESRTLLSTAPVVYPDLAASVVDTGMTLKASTVPGDHASVPVLIVNKGDGTAVCTAKVNIFLSSDSLLSSSDTLIGTKQVSLSLAPGKLSTVTVPVTVPLMSAGKKWVIAQVTTTMKESSTSNNVDPSNSTITVMDSFGNLTGRSGSTKLVLSNPATGHPVTFTLTGPGMATVQTNGDISVSGSTSATSISIITTGSEFYQLRNFSAGSGLGTLNAPRVDTVGNLVIGSSSNSITLDTMADGSLLVKGHLNQFKAAQVTGGTSIEVDTIDMFSITGRGGSKALPGNFNGTLWAHNTAGHSTAIGAFSVAGAASHGWIEAQRGSIGSVTVGGAWITLPSPQIRISPP